MSKESLNHLAQEMVECLAPIGPVDTKPMFGAIALRKDGVMLGFVHDGRFYLKVDQEGISRFESLGGEPFAYEMNGRTMTSRSTWSVPDEILEDTEQLIAWAERAVDVATTAKSARKPKRTR